ncbi:MAG: DUF3463 domain-containing protein, partial [Candidatus Eiseniibacteriota bacterium]
SFAELMDTTNWDSYGTGNYEKCADCMVHCGYEGTAVADTMTRPMTALSRSLFGVKTSGPMAPEMPLDKQRPAEYVFSRHVEKFMGEIHAREAKEASRVAQSDAA